jgi:hypothetical protein
MSNSNGWHRPQRVEVNGQPLTLAGVVRQVVFLGVFFALVGGIVLYRKLGFGGSH